MYYFLRQKMEEIPKRRIHFLCEYPKYFKGYDIEIELVISENE